MNETRPIGRLTLVGTPIGNLSDLSPRAVAALEECDFIAAEDTRVTLKLLNHFGISKPLISYFEHNKYERGQVILARLQSGESGVLVTDAGMPAISDPGEMLVDQCHAAGVEVGVVPGPTAVTTALAVAGLPTGRFTFEGFLSVNKKSRREHLASLLREPRTMVFYEAPHKLIYTLQDLLDALGDRRVALVRELTKIHEEVIRTTLSGALARYTDSGDTPRGEYVLIVEGAASADEPEMTPDDAAALARDYMAEGMSASEAAKKAAAAAGLKKGDIYKQIIR